MTTCGWILLMASIVSTASVAAICPSPCQCAEGKVDCTRAGLWQWPTTLPRNTHTLILKENAITEIESQLLATYPQLKTLVLSHNRIKQMSVDQFHQLENLDVSHNRIGNLHFLAHLPKLQFLNLANNQLDRLANDTFHNNNKLNWLSLDSNPIVKLSSQLFRRNGQLEHVSLSNLEIGEIPARLLDPLTRLKKLQIRHNGNVKSLRDDSFHYLGSLNYLHLENNSLITIPRSIRELDALKYLNLDDNPLVCDCQLYWFANWVVSPTKVELSKLMACSDGGKPLVQHLLRLQCTPVRLETPSFHLEQVFGRPVTLTCNFSGNPSPHVTWITPDRQILKWPPSAINQQLTNNQSVKLLSADQLQVASLSRHTAGAYACHASNPLSNVTAFIRVQITPTGFRRVQIESIYVGFGCVLAFAVITLIVQGFRYLMDRFGWWECCYCCGKRLSPRAKQIRHVLEAIEQYKSQQLDRLRDNYNAQVHRIRDNCVQQMEKIQSSYQGQVKYLRGVRDYGTQQLTTIREQYNDQAKKVYGYTVDRLQTVQRNYVSQRARVRKFSAHQLIRLREKYKFQQKTLNKILENLPAFYIDSCRNATCARTDSIYFQDETDVDVVDSIIKQSITLGLTLQDGQLNEDLDSAIDPADLVLKCRKKMVAHGRQPSATSLDFSFLFPPIRFPSRLQWRRRNTVDEEVDVHDADAMEQSPTEDCATAVEVSVEICPIPESIDDGKVATAEC